MGRSAKVMRMGSFSTHKKNVRRRHLVVEKRVNKKATVRVPAAATDSKAPKAPREAVRDAAAMEEDKTP